MKFIHFIVSAVSAHITYIGYILFKNSSAHTSSPWIRLTFSTITITKYIYHRHSRNELIFQFRSSNVWQSRVSHKRHISYWNIWKCEGNTIWKQRKCYRWLLSYVVELVCRLNVLCFIDDEPMKLSDCTNSLCNTLEAIFLHGLKDSFLRQTISVLAGGEIDRRPEPNFWPPLLVILHKETIAQVSCFLLTLSSFKWTLRLRVFI